MRHDENGIVSPMWPRMKREFGIGVEHARQHHADRERRGLHGEAPAGRGDAGMLRHVVLEVKLDHGRVRHAGMEIERHVERLGALEDRPEALVVEEHAVAQPVHHGADEAVLRHDALEFVGGRLGLGRRQRAERGKARGIGRHRRGEPVVDAARQHRPFVGVQALRRGRAVRQHLEIDAGLVHVLDAERRRDRRAAPAGARCGALPSGRSWRRRCRGRGNALRAR